MKSTEVEKAFLGCVVADPSLLNVTDLEPDDFGATVTRAVYEAMTALHDRGEPANDWLCIENEMGSGLQAVGGMAAIMSWTWDTEFGSVNLLNAEGYARVIVEQSDRRRLAARLTEAAKRGLSGELAIDEAIAVVEKAASYRDREPSVGIAAIASTVWDNAEEYHQNPLPAGKVRGLDTGWTDVNRVTGGWRPGMYIVMAVPHLGKSWFVLHTAAHACSLGKRVLMFPLEMAASDLVTRLCTSAAGVLKQVYESGQMNSDEYKRFSDRAAAISEWRLEIDDRACSLAQVSTKIRRTHRREPVDLVVIDTLGLLAGGKSETRNVQLGDTTRALKLLSREIGVPFLVPHHVSAKEIARRNNKRPRLGDEYESGHIGQDADVIIGLHRDGFFDPKCDDPNTMEILILKDRLGGQTGGWASLLFDSFGDLRSLARQEEEEEIEPWWH